MESVIPHEALLEMALDVVGTTLVAGTGFAVEE